MTDHGSKGRAKAQRGPWVTEVVKGSPLQVAGRELVPVVRVTSRVRRRASLYRSGVSGQGYGIVHMKPLAILDGGEESKSHQIRDETARAIRGLALAALLVPLLALLLIHLSRRPEHRDAQRPSA